MAHFRMNQTLKAKAKEDVLDVLRAHYPSGLSLKDLANHGTRRFHGMRTMTVNQLRPLIKELEVEKGIYGKVVEWGLYSTVIWTAYKHQAPVDNR